MVRQKPKERRSTDANKASCCQSKRKRKEKQGAQPGVHSRFLLGFLPRTCWGCRAFWLFSCVFRTADSCRSCKTRPSQARHSLAPLPSRAAAQLFRRSALHLLLLEPLIALLLHGGPPGLLSEPLLQDFLLALPQLLLIVAPGPLLSLQPVELPRDCRESAGAGTKV